MRERWADAKGLGGCFVCAVVWCVPAARSLRPRHGFLLLVFAGLPVVVLAQSQLVTEGNLTDAILERAPLSASQANSLDLNRDGVVDIADLTYHMVHQSDLVPAVSFMAQESTAREGSEAVGVRVIFTKAFEVATAVSYTLGGTAVHGPKAQGGDYTIAGYDSGAEVGAATVEAGEREVFLAMTIHDDAVFGEGMETVTISLGGGGDDTYMLGVRQQHIFYIDDNDCLWRAELDFPGGSGYEALSIEIVEEEGTFSGRVVGGGGVVPMPEPGDAGASGDDGWEAHISSGTRSLRIEIGPLPVAKTLSFFGVDYARSYVLEVAPGAGEYRYDTYGTMQGLATQTLVPVDGRLGSELRKRAFLARESSGTLAMHRAPSRVAAEGITLVDGE